MTDGVAVWTAAAETVGALASAGAVWVALVLANRSRRESLELRDRERRQQAVRVFATVSIEKVWDPGEGMDFDYAEVTYRNASDAPVYDVRGQVRAGVDALTYPVESLRVLAQGRKSVVHSSTAVIKPGTVDPQLTFWFRDASDVNWRRDPDGTLAEGTPPQTLTDTPKPIE